MPLVTRAAARGRAAGGSVNQLASAAWAIRRTARSTAKTGSLEPPFTSASACATARIAAASDSGVQARSSRRARSTCHEARPRSRTGSCLLYTSDAADDLTRVDLGGRRLIKKKKKKEKDKYIDEMKKK